MASISKNIIDVFIKMIQSLECPVCYEYVSSPIWQCEAGHILCNTCRRSIFSCPTCRRSFSTVRVRSLEQISDFMLFPCKNNGCEKILPLKDIQSHENMCTLANAFSRPDDLTRFTILQYNILKYIEHDIAPFLVTSRQTNEQATQTNFERRNSENASTMTDSMPNVGITGSSFQDLKVTLKPNATTPSQSLHSNCEERNAPVTNSFNGSKAQTSYTYPFSKNASQDKMFKKPEFLTKNKEKGSSNNLVRSEKVNKSLGINESKSMSKKFSTSYDCYLQSSSNKSAETPSAPTRLNFNPFTKQPQSIFPTISQVSGSEKRFQFDINTKACLGNLSSSILSPGPSTSSSKAESVFNFQATDKDNLIRSKCKSKKSCKSSRIQYIKEFYTKNTTKFDLSSLLNVPPVVTSDENRVITNIFTSCFNTTTVSSFNTSSSSTQSIRSPVMSSLIFGDISFDNNLRGSLECVSHRVSSVFNSEKKDEQFLPNVSLPILQESLSTCPVFSFSIGRSSATTNSQTHPPASNSSLSLNCNTSTQSSCNVSSSGSTVKIKNSDSIVEENTMNVHTSSNSNSGSATRAASPIQFEINQQLVDTLFGESSTTSVQNCVSNVKSEMNSLENTACKPRTNSPVLPQHGTISTTNKDNDNITRPSVRNCFSDPSIINSTVNRIGLISEGVTVTFPTNTSPTLKTKCEVSSAILGPLFVSKIDKGNANSTQSNLNSLKFTFGSIAGSSQPIQNTPALNFDTSSFNKSNQSSHNFHTSSEVMTSTSISLNNISSSTKSDNQMFKPEQSNSFPSSYFSFSEIQNDSNILNTQEASAACFSNMTAQKSLTCFNLKDPNSNFVVNERQVAEKTSRHEPKHTLASVISSSANSSFLFSNASFPGITYDPQLATPGTSGCVQEGYPSVLSNIKVESLESNSSNATMHCSVNSTKPTSVSVDCKPFNFDNPVLFCIGSGINTSKGPVSSSQPNTQTLAFNSSFTFDRQSNNL